MVRAAALENNAQPAYFGLGFIQLKLTDELRMHFYSNKLDPILDDEEVHDHRYAFDSMVYRGILENRIFYYQPTLIKHDWELVEVHCVPGSDGDPKVIFPNVEKVELGTFHTLTGDEYYLSSSAFHSVRPLTNYVITRLIRGTPERDTAKVIRNKVNPFVCPFSAPISVEKCWEHIDEVINGTLEIL